MKRPAITQPQLVPVTSVDDHLPAVPDLALTASAVRARLAAVAAWTPEFAGDGGLFADREPAGAAVLVPLVQREAGLNLLLTRRTDHLRDHAGQISFPGGRVEPEDDGPVGTALRETEEEIGLSRQHIEIIGQLPVYSTVTAFQVTPVVGLVEPEFTLKLDDFEVAEAFEVPLAFLMNPAHHRHHRFEFAGAERRFMSMPWQGPEREYFIWGATAAMLRNFYRLLSDA
ncbi:8-oxo-dGTP pyrophosphatase MutT (NUDIX family) [Pelomonas saccharophila]|uniref:8-oxo-dGTP pyrophosphatase MutT (NUDIX family) n=1 Tax=Roseateles saccharophilus TaxID=304 RepID=A0ABU1YFK1_ROSSA|nr:CoA pyrophosphatase [Roseateles saccharophilus]MDR7267630.1 8-oxo-dGTP pyrophosphatase MutT (NUDIX family) [Roseateles saccharophilus]